MIPPVKGEKVLVSCLNWGWGHVSRSIGLIHQLIQNENEVVVAGSADQLEVFKQYFPDLTTVLIEDYPFKFKGKGNFGLDILFASSQYVRTIKKELSAVDKLIEEIEPTLIIADHRYGFRSDKVKSVFLTHQLRLPLKWWQRSFQSIHKGYLKKFDEIWVCDTAGHLFAGKLSKPLKDVKCIYIGILSRFQKYSTTEIKEGEVVVVSGPSPYNEQLIDQYKSVIEQGAMVIGSQELLNKKQVSVNQQITNWLEGDQYLLKAEKIYSYSGYSTLMDLAFLNCEAELVATKGQAEQEYLLSIKKY